MISERTRLVRGGLRMALGCSGVWKQRGDGTDELGQRSLQGCLGLYPPPPSFLAV